MTRVTYVDGLAPNTKPANAGNVRRKAPALYGDANEGVGERTF